MARFAIIENGLVANVAEANDEFAAQQGWIPAENVSPGWGFIDGKFIEPVSEASAKTAPTKETLMAQIEELSAQIKQLS